ncbi:MAG: hypothetical protein MUO53_10590 [Maribacter sp.]|nr:hypothetical protein [Maribacter sp.]
MEEKSLRFISISHKTASVSQREIYYISDEEKIRLAALVRHTFPDIVGLFLLSTCNRTEIYFESTTTSSKTFRDFFIELKAMPSSRSQTRLFTDGNITKDTVRHLLEVSSGLASSVLGDAEIIHQVKKAYQFSIHSNLQGSMLERAMQTVFRAHKRISNETHFRDGTTSIAYKALKVVSDTFTKDAAKFKKILFIGTGDIVMQLLKYNFKFNFESIYIANRTEERAIKVSLEHHCKTYEWRKVLNNDFEDFDVIISAVSNRHHLIKKIKSSSQKIVVIDLALPSNINYKLAQDKQIIFHDLDTISVEMEDTKEKRLAAIGKVDTIVLEEAQAYNEWLQTADLRSFLAEYKTIVNHKVIRYFETESEEYNFQMVKTITDRVMRKFRKQTAFPTPLEEIDALIAEQAVQTLS